MEAKLREDYPQRTIQALEGHEYVKYEFRPVPVGREEEALQHRDLLINDSPIVVNVLQVADQADPAQTVSPAAEFAPTPFVLAEEEQLSAEAPAIVEADVPVVVAEAEAPATEPKPRPSASGRNKNK